ncbi:MAG: hypothetical protein MI724_03285, partial [Spirochaetales bacterium]|nr:hypothetical protein [Spirochaetales bacterium]
MKTFGSIGTVALLLVFLAACVTPQGEAGGNASPEAGGVLAVPPGFGGRYLVALSDTDTLASAYVDDLIGDPVDGRDTLTVLGLGRSAFVAELAVSNSVWAPPTIALSPDGTVAYVLEIREPREAGDVTFEEDLAFSTHMSVVNLSYPRQPALVEVVELGRFAGHYIDINDAGDTLAITNWAPDAQLLLLPVDGTAVGEVQRFSLGIENDFAFPNTVEWRDDTTLGVVVGPLNVVAFYSVATAADGAFAVTALGEPVPVGLFPFTALWSRDGSAFITADMNWNLEVGVTDFNNTAGSLSIVRPDFDVADGIVHRVVPGPAVPANPEGLAIGPEGDIVVTVNLERSHLPENPSAASLSLMTFDPERGRLAWLADYAIDGVLPEGVVFDTTGNYVAVAVFDQFGAGAGVGRID